MAPQASTKLTYEDYVLIPNDGQRHEIIDGEHYVSPSPTARHQEILLNLTLLLGMFIRQRRLGRLFAAPFDVVLSSTNVVQPDLIFITAAREHIVTKPNVQGAPDLAIEILSHGTRRLDEREKFRQYDAFGVAEYWIVDGEAESVRIHRRDGGALKLAETVSQEGSFTSPLFPGLTIELADVFERS